MRRDDVEGVFGVVERCLDGEVGAVVFDHVARREHDTVVAGLGAQCAVRRNSAAAPDHVGEWPDARPRST
jgi:hypothetical protein